MIARPDLVAMASLYCGPGITILPLPHDDGWIRDVGPSFVAGPAGELAGVTWNFNGWGELHPDYAQDAELGAPDPRAYRRCRGMSGRLVLEGGAIQVDGEGTCIAGYGPAARPQAQSRPERWPRPRPSWGDRLGVEKVIWLPDGLIDDEAGGHVDNVAMFARPGLVLALTTDDRSDAAYDRPRRANLDVLRGAVDARGRTLEVVTVPQPKARPRHDGRRLPLSHLNCYLANGAVIMPELRRRHRQGGGQGVRRRLARIASWCRSTRSTWSRAAAASTRIALGQPAA